MFKNILSFNGRIRRTDFALTLFLLYVICILITSFFEFLDLNYFTTIGFNNFLIGFSLYIFFAQSAKRMHDMGISGWLTLLPIYNPIIPLLGKGQKGKNEYGEDPRKPITFPNSFLKDSQPITSNTAPTPSPFPTPTNIVEPPQPQSDYLLSLDRQILIKWNNYQSSYINMGSDPNLKEVTTIGRDAFFNCPQLTKIILPQKLNRIEKTVFNDCLRLENLTFPSQLTFIGEYIFGKETPSTLTFESAIPPFLEGDFAYDESPLIGIYVPENSLKAYRNHPSWKKYTPLMQPNTNTTTIS